MLRPISSTCLRILSLRGRRQRLNFLRMAGVFVRCIPDEERMQISVIYGHNGGKERTYNLDRLQSEESGRTLTRLQQNILKHVSKKLKRKSKDKTEATDIEAEILINLFCRNERVEDATLNRHAWLQDGELEICDKRLRIEVNLPVVKSLSLPTNIMAGFPVFPKFSVEFTNLYDSMFKWYQVQPKGSESECHEQGAAMKVKLSDLNAGSMTEVSSSIVFIPSISDIGNFLKIECIPKKGDRAGVVTDCLSVTEVSAGPGLCPFESRHLYTPTETEPGSFRVVSYNILADLYADSDFSRNELYPYCPPYALSLDYRKQLLLKEIMGYNADIVCLQECDKKLFEGDLLQAMDVSGHDGWLKIKSTSTPEGSATFYRRSKFNLVSQHEATLTDFLKTDPTNADLWEKVCSQTALRDKMESRSTCLQATVLESTHNSNHFLCVVNTHLYFHPRADNIRALQVGLSSRYIQQICQPYNDKGEKIAVVFCGDFNSSPKRAVTALLTTGHIPADFDDWSTGGEEELISCELSHKPLMRSGCGYVDYTNYTAGFAGMLDYIFVDDTNLEVVQAIPMPDHEEVTQHCALPSVVFPSDHIAQICDIRWK